MTIEIRENPQGIKNVNKYIEKDGDGWRGYIVALSKDKTEAIIMGASNLLPLLIREYDDNCYPQVVKAVDRIPADFDIVEENIIKYPALCFSSEKN